MFTVCAGISAHARELGPDLTDQKFPLLPFSNGESSLQNVVYKITVRNRVSGYHHIENTLANWSFIIVTIGLTPSCLGDMISSINTRRLSRSAVTRAFSQTLEANLWRDMFNI